MFVLSGRNDDADVEDFGNKWSLGALLRYLHSQGIDTTGQFILVHSWMWCPVWLTGG